MSELKAYRFLGQDEVWLDANLGSDYYLKSEADKVIAEKDAEIAKLQAMLEERNKQVGELKHRIAPKQSDKTLQELLNEVCKKHGVSTLQDLDWAFCESEKRRTKDNIDAVNIIYHQKYKRCLAMARWCEATALWCYQAANTLPKGFQATLYGKPVMIEPDRLFKRFVRLNNWSKLWRKLAEKFKEGLVIGIDKAIGTDKTVVINHKEEK